MRRTLPPAGEGTLLYEQTGTLLARKVESGLLGGDQAVGAMVSAGNIRAIVLLHDPLMAHPNQADTEALGRLADAYQVPFATNTATAAAGVRALADRAGDQTHVDPELMSTQPGKTPMGNPA